MITKHWILTNPFTRRLYGRFLQACAHLRFRPRFLPLGLALAGAGALALGAIGFAAGRRGVANRRRPSNPAG